MNLGNLQRKLCKRIRVSFAQDSQKCQNYKLRTVGIWTGERFSYPVTWDQALFIYLFIFLLLCFFGSRGEKNNAWYIHWTSHQPPPNLHNLTFARPVMLLANQRLRHGNQILAGIMPLSKSILERRKFLSTFRWRFLKKIFKCFFFLAMKYC